MILVVLMPYLLLMALLGWLMSLSFRKNKSKFFTIYTLVVVFIPFADIPYVYFKVKSLCKEAGLHVYEDVGRVQNVYMRDTKLSRFDHLNVLSNSLSFVEYGYEREECWKKNGESCLYRVNVRGGEWGEPYPISEVESDFEFIRRESFSRVAHNFQGSSSYKLRNINSGRVIFEIKRFRMDSQFGWLLGLFIPTDRSICQVGDYSTTQLNKDKVLAILKGENRG